jgi:hypothetical protein
VFNTHVLLQAVGAACGSSAFALFPVLGDQSVIAWIVVLWIILGAVFLANQRALAKIIRRAKREKLTEIEDRIAEVEANRDITEKETMEAINRMMDYRDRIKATRNSALDAQAVARLLQSLLLPLIASLLANVERVLRLFK